VSNQNDELCADLRRLADAIRSSHEELRDTVGRLETAVSRACVVWERQLASSDAAQRQAKRHAEAMVTPALLGAARNLVRKGGGQ